MLILLPLIETAIKLPIEKSYPQVSQGKNVFSAFISVCKSFGLFLINLMQVFQEL
jgi:hypothetical protein